jgi:hypothetical protein
MQRMGGDWIDIATESYFLLVGGAPGDLSGTAIRSSRKVHSDPGFGKVGGVPDLLA